MILQAGVIFPHHSPNLVSVLSFFPGRVSALADPKASEYHLGKAQRLTDELRTLNKVVVGTAHFCFYPNIKNSAKRD